MSIVFNNPDGINENKLRMAYNNDVLEFRSTTVTANPMYCDVALGTFTFRLYPAPDNTFFLNFKPYVTSLINTRNFEDNTVPTLDSTDNTTYSYPFANGTLLERAVAFKMYFDNDTLETANYQLTWIAGAMQIYDFVNLDKNKLSVLSPLSANTTNHYYLKYWQGYPFDMALYTPFPETYLRNETLNFGANFPAPEKACRLYYSDGRTDETLEEFLPVADGFNTIRIKTALQESSEDKFLKLQKIPLDAYGNCGGYYFKWLNHMGGYNYWLFNNVAMINRSVRQLGGIENDFGNLGHTKGSVLQLGNQTQDTIKVTSDILESYEQDILKGLLDSPKVYLFTGKPFSRNDANNWAEVVLKNSSVTIQNYKSSQNVFSLEFELPQRYTQTLN